MTALTILYATDDMPSRLASADSAAGWHVVSPASINEGLALSVYYAPHAIVIDGDSAWLDELTLHVMHVTGPSPRGRDIVVRIGGAPLSFDVPDFITYRELPADVSPDELAATLAVLDTARLHETGDFSRLGAA